MGDLEILMIISILNLLLLPLSEKKKKNTLSVYGDIIIT